MYRSTPAAVTSGGIDRLDGAVATNWTSAACALAAAERAEAGGEAVREAMRFEIWDCREEIWDWICGELVGVGVGMGMGDAR